jgi:hypothetical protein
MRFSLTSATVHVHLVLMVENVSDDMRAQVIPVGMLQRVLRVADYFIGRLLRIFACRKPRNHD